MSTGFGEFTDCSGACEDCQIHYDGGCVAGHGDNYFKPITERQRKIINSPEYKERKKQQEIESDKKFREFIESRKVLTVREHIDIIRKIQTKEGV